MVLYAKFAHGSQFLGEKTICKSITWFTSYDNYCDEGEFRIPKLSWTAGAELGNVSI